MAETNIETLFREAAEDVKRLAQRPSNEILLQLYGLYKQATVGDCNQSRPSFYQFEAKAKWDAWTGYKGISKDDAMKKYAELVEGLKK